MLRRIAAGGRPSFARTQGSLLVLLALIAVFGLVAPGFFTVSNVDTIIRQGAMLAIVTFGMTLVIATGGIDLSSGSIMALTAIITGHGLVAGWPAPLPLIVALVGAAACGLVSGLLVAEAGIPSFVATLGMMGIARGLALALSDGRPISGLDRGLIVLLNSDLLGLPVPLLLVMAALLVTHVLLGHTRWGIGLLALGGNRTGARLAGLRTRRDEGLVYTYAALLAGVAGLLTIARMDVAHPLAGSGLEFDAIAAAVIGGAALEGGRGSATGALLGAAFITILRNGLSVMGASLHVQLLVVGLVIALAFALDRLTGRERSASLGVA